MSVIVSYKNENTLDMLQIKIKKQETLLSAALQPLQLRAIVDTGPHHQISPKEPFLLNLNRII